MRKDYLMWVEKNKDNEGKVISYKYRKRYEDPLTGKIKSVSANNKKKTKKIEQEMLSLLNDKIDKLLNATPTPDNVTFEELSDKYMAVNETEIKPSTFVTKSGRINVINKKIGHYQLKTLTPALVNDALLEWSNTHATKTVKAIKSTIGQVITFGIRYGYFHDINFNSQLFYPKKESANLDWKYLEPHELESAYQQLKDKGWNNLLDMCRFQVNTGMRYGEMVALDYEKHIDFERNTITIERTYSQHTKSFDTPKNNKSRTISVKPDLMAMIQRLIHEDKVKMIRHGLDKNNTLLFRSMFDKPLSITTMNYRLKEIQIEGKNLSTHIFRHTFITHMVEAKVPSRQIAEYVDNSTEMIERVYTHFSQKMQDELSEAVQVMKFM